MTLDFVCVISIDSGFGSWADGYGRFKLIMAPMSHPSHLCGETFDMLLLPFQVGFRYEERCG
jgi:hypothetical protein